MPLKKQQFQILKDDLTKAIDVDDSAGRSVPTNMNFVEEGYLIKDTGYIPLGASTSTLDHSIFVYKKKNGTVFLIRGKETKLQQYSFPDRAWNDIVGSPTFTEGAEFGYITYDDELWFCNGVESMYKFDGTTFTAYPSSPKGNILEVYEDRLYVSGVLLQPLTLYYSNLGDPATFDVASLITPLGTDSITALVNYYGTLLIFKTESIWKHTFIFDQVVSLFQPKLEVQSNKYGACSKKVVTWAENDIWFFTGREVRSIGYKDQQIGILGVNNSVISDQIKQTLKGIDVANFAECSSFYHQRRYHLAVPLNSDKNDTTFVCHLLYQNNWTKYTGRDKARFRSAAILDEVVYTTNADVPYGVVKWTVESEDSQTQNLTRVSES